MLAAVFASVDSLMANGSIFTMPRVADRQVVLQQQTFNEIINRANQIHRPVQFRIWLGKCSDRLKGGVVNLVIAFAEEIVISHVFVGALVFHI